MKTLYLDCFSGISGDMLLGALIDLGTSADQLRAELGKLDLPGYDITVAGVNKQGISATKFDCRESDPQAHHHRGYRDIVALIERSELSDPVKHRAVRVFHRLGEAESKIHGVSLDKIHFHEVGAIDSIVDIVGGCIALDLLTPDRVECLPPPLGHGHVETAHGHFPVPAPATLEILRGIPTTSCDIEAELVTPTGAALLAEWVDAFGPLPDMTLDRIGYGAGTRDLARRPNVLRVILGDTVAETGSSERDRVSLLETNLDDMNPELFSDVMEQCFAGGALDVWLTPIQMKKNRPGTQLSVLCQNRDTQTLAELILSHTTTFGVRINELHREILTRELVTVSTRFGEVRLKVGRRHGKSIRCSPEYESCRQLAASANVSVAEVFTAAHQAAAQMEVS